MLAHVEFLPRSDGEATHSRMIRFQRTMSWHSPESKIVIYDGGRMPQRTAVVAAAADLDLDQPPQERERHGLRLIRRAKLARRALGMLIDRALGDAQNCTDLP